MLAAWKGSDDGEAFEAALAEKGYRLAQGDRSAMIVDPAGVKHRATEILGTAGRKLEGRAIAAADVHAPWPGSTSHCSTDAQALRDVRREAKSGEPKFITTEETSPQGAASTPVIGRRRRWSGQRARPRRWT